jgi:hypothetical protein
VTCGQSAFEEGNAGEALMNDDATEVVFSLVLSRPFWFNLADLVLATCRAARDKVVPIPGELARSLQGCQWQGPRPRAHLKELCQ